MILALALACAPDDVTDETKDTGDTAADTDTDTDSDTDTDTDTDAGPGDITGIWLSEGDDVADLLATYFSSLEATFGADGSYAVVATATNGAEYDLTGTYVVDTTTNPGTIVVTQTSPTAVTAQGIWQVSGDTLTYEVAQTAPDQGYTPPTPEAGFGSTGGAGVEEGSNIQIYQRQ